MSLLNDYLTEVRLSLIDSPIIAEYQIVRAWIKTDVGYVRFRATLTNDDFLEAAEYFGLERMQVKPNDYHYQWMNDDKTELRRRWDNTPHFPQLDNFPHHIHLDDKTVVPGQAMSILELLSTLAGLV